MPPVGFEPTISVGERPKTYDFDRAATGTDIMQGVVVISYLLFGTIYRSLLQESRF